MEAELIELARNLGAELSAKELKIAVAESCTGGMICQMMTSIPGSSAWFERGFVTYSNAAKIEMLGVDPQTIAQFGAVSGQSARQMAKGAIKHSAADCSIAVTGVAGPDGGTPDKPVGTVFVAYLLKEKPCQCEKLILNGDRQLIREQTTKHALQALFIHLQG
jgi:nicotinamide-nucleotide amidase